MAVRAGALALGSKMAQTHPSRKHPALRGDANHSVCGPRLTSWVIRGQSSREDLTDDVAVDVGEAALDAVVVVGEALVVDAQQV